MNTVIQFLYNSCSLKDQTFQQLVAPYQNTRMRHRLIRPLEILKMGDELFSQDTVRDFMASKGGKVKNHELVTHFRRFLNDPQRKGT